MVSCVDRALLTWSHACFHKQRWMWSVTLVWVQVYPKEDLQSCQSSEPQEYCLFHKACISSLWKFTLSHRQQGLLSLAWRLGLCRLLLWCCCMSLVQVGKHTELLAAAVWSAAACLCFVHLWILALFSKVSAFLPRWHQVPCPLVAPSALPSPCAVSVVSPCFLDNQSHSVVLIGISATFLITFYNISIWFLKRLGNFNLRL